VNKWKYLKGMIGSDTVDMICIQETKLGDLQPSSCYNLWGDNNIEWINKPTSSNSGGVLTMWHKNKFKRVKHFVGNSFIGVIGEYSNSINSNPILVVVLNVYSSCNYKEKVGMWEQLINIKAGEACRQWCVLGDFNAVRKINERKGLNPRGNTSLREMQGFNNFIESMELVDVPLIEGNTPGTKKTDRQKVELIGLWSHLNG